MYLEHPVEKMIMDQRVQFAYGKVDDKDKRFVSLHFEGNTEEWSIMIQEVEKAIKRGLKRISKQKDVFS